MIRGWGSVVKERFKREREGEKNEREWGLVAMAMERGERKREGKKNGG